jgi:hypothetical protein
MCRQLKRSQELSWSPKARVLRRVKSDMSPDMRLSSVLCGRLSIYLSLDHRPGSQCLSRTAGLRQVSTYTLSRPPFAIHSEPHPSRLTAFFQLTTYFF